MAQMFFLVIKAKQNFVGDGVILDESQGQESTTLRSRFRNWRSGRSALKSRWSLTGESLSVEQGGLDKLQSSSAADSTRADSSTTPYKAGPGNGEPHPRQDSRSKPTLVVRWYQDPATLSASVAAILFFAVLAVQILGFAEAVKAARSPKSPPLASWCSPLFQPFGLAVVDSNCHVYSIAQSSARGIGCIKIPGVWQYQWIKGTVAGTILELICESIDVLILALVSKTRKVRGAKLKRPWATIFSGVTVLGVTLIFGIQYASNMPTGMGKRVTVAIGVRGPSSYVGDLSTAGLRGAILGWNDGLFESWRSAYFGDPIL